jgi:hypothetical protein
VYVYLVQYQVIFGSSFIIYVSYDIQVQISSQVIIEWDNVLGIYELSFFVLLPDDRSFIVSQNM